MAQLAADMKLPRRDVKHEFGISEIPAKRVLGELSEGRMIGFDRLESPGFHRLKLRC